MAKNTRKRCPHCGFLETIKWGKRTGHFRYYCKNCGSYFTGSRKDVSSHNKQVWFREWVVGKQSIEQLSMRSGYSVRYLKNYFYPVLPACPVWHIQRQEKANLLIDGKQGLLGIYRDINIRMTTFYRSTDGEYLRGLKEDLQNIKNTGIESESVTCDGTANILRAVREVCPEAVLQRCIVHIARELKF